MKLALLAAAAAALVAAAPAAAATYLITFGTPTGDTGTGYFTTPTAGASTITTFTGAIDGSAITGLSGYAGADESFNPATPYFTLGGTSVSTASGVDYNLYFDGANYNLIDSFSDPAGDGANSRFLTPLTITAVPEPAAWGLMIAGFAMTGFAARRRTTAIAA